jgi:hypothetical protein
VSRTIAARKQTRPEEPLSYPWNGWSCSSLLEVAVLYDLKLHVETRLKTEGNAISKSDKRGLLLGGTRPASNQVQPPSKEMTALILPIEPPLKFDEPLRNVLAKLLDTLEHGTVSSLLREICRYSQIAIDDHGGVQSKDLQRVLKEEKLPTEESTEILRMVRRANRQHRNPLRCIWSRTSDT